MFPFDSSTLVMDYTVGGFFSAINKHARFDQDTSHVNLIVIPKHSTTCKIFLSSFIVYNAKSVHIRLSSKI